MSKSVNCLYMAGIVTNVRESTPKDPTRNPSAIITIEFGSANAASSGNSPTKRVPAAEVRIPAHMYPKLKERLVVGAYISCHGHLQGVSKKVDAHNLFTAELVADRVELSDTSLGQTSLFFVSGTLCDVQTMESGNGRGPFAVALVQYGPAREETGNKVEFINAVQFRVPPHRHAKASEVLSEGTEVLVQGRVQGVIRTFNNELFYSVELVADSVK